MAQERVLVVDDEQLNLFIIKEFLDGEGLELDAHADPLVAWECLIAPNSDYSLVILDRMMPGLDGLDFLKRMKEEARFMNIPVIMQTAAAAPEQVRQGLEAGAYYYLTKPYEPEALISIVRGALEDRRNRDQLRRRAAQLNETQRQVLSVEYRFSSLAEVANLVPALAALCPEPDVVAPGLSDLMVNAVEHGNLAVSYKEKAQLKWEGTWEAEIERRLGLPEYCQRFATIHARRDPDQVVFTITDQGDGFDWQKFLGFDPERAFDPNGRGIAMARMMSFDQVDYRGKGNVVVACVKVV